VSVRRLLVIALALGLLFGLAACVDTAEPEDVSTMQESTMHLGEPFDLAGYQSMLRAFTMHPGDYAKRRGTCDGLRGEIAGEIEALFRPLKEYPGELPDEAILAFMQWFMPECYSLGSDTAYAAPEVYPYTAYEPGENGGIEYRPNYAYILFELTAKPSPGMANWLLLKDEAEDLGTEFDLQAFERSFPALAEKIRNTKYTLPLGGGEKEFTM
jgi:hypothetical protein